MKLTRTGKFYWYDGLSFTYENGKVIQHAGLLDEKRFKAVEKLIKEQKK